MSLVCRKRYRRHLYLLTAQYLITPYLRGNLQSCMYCVYCVGTYEKGEKRSKEADAHGGVGGTVGGGDVKTSSNGAPLAEHQYAHIQLVAASAPNDAAANVPPRQATPVRYISFLRRFISNFSSLALASYLDSFCDPFHTLCKWCEKDYASLATTA